MIKDISVGMSVLVEDGSYVVRGTISRIDGIRAVITGVNNRNERVDHWNITKRDDGYWGCNFENGFLKHNTIQKIEALQ